MFHQDLQWVYPIAVRLRQTRSGARSQALPALPGNVFLAALPPVQFVGGRSTCIYPNAFMGSGGVLVLPAYAFWIKESNGIHSVEAVCTLRFLIALSCGNLR